jgi:hypothetical protein
VHQAYPMNITRISKGCPTHAPYLPHRCPISFKIRDIYGTYMGHLWDILPVTFTEGALYLPARASWT